MLYTVKLNSLNNLLATMKTYNLRILLGASLFLFLFQPILSDEDVRYYDIEIVVFENLEDTIENNEIWPTSKQLVIPENAAILGRKFEGKLPPEYDPSLLFNTLSIDDYQLKEEVENIKASEQYRLLLHTGWRQPGLPQKQAITVYFNHAISENDEPEIIEETNDLTNVARPGETASETSPEPSPSLPSNATANLQGLITIALARYLHLSTEMIYMREPKTDMVDMFDSSFLEDRRGKDSVYYLKQDRRMRSKETHYIDHPKFSMLIRITQYEGMNIKGSTTQTN